MRWHLRISKMPEFRYCDRTTAKRLDGVGTKEVT